MPEVDDLARRIDAEFAASAEKLKQFQARKVEEYHGREERLGQFGRLCDELRGVWAPRLEALARRFGKEVTLTPKVTPSQREATFAFQSKLARIELKFTVSTDPEVRRLVLDYHLEIIPILMRFDAHRQVEYPLDAVDRAAAAQWIDDRIVDFVRTYLALHENEYYLKDHMVEDPIAGVRFPSLAASGKLGWKGKTYYFIDDNTRREFARQNGISES
jgi:YHS domain-containing protein